MSVVAVKVYDDKIEFAADTISVRGATKGTISKLEKINGMIIGGVGYAEESSLLYIFAQTHSPLNNTEKAVIDFFFEFGKWKNELNLGFSSNNNYIFGYKGRVFMVDNLFVKRICDYEAIGAGKDFSLAALYLGHSAVESVVAACNLSCWVSEPIDVLEMRVEDQNSCVKDEKEIS